MALDPLAQPKAPQTGMPDRDPASGTDHSSAMQQGDNPLAAAAFIQKPGIEMFDDMSGDCCCDVVIDRVHRAKVLINSWVTPNYLGCVQLNSEPSVTITV